MKKMFMFVLLIFLLGSCADAGDVTDYEVEKQSVDNMAENISNHLANYAEIKDCNVQIDSDTAVISLNLTKELNDADLIALKQRVANDVKSRNNNIKHVAVNTAPYMLERVRGKGDNAPDIEESLEKNRNEEIFVNTIPTI